jgi:RND superfamily putative drug exporter
MSARHPWKVLCLWIVVIVFAGVAAGGLGSALTTDADFTNNPESIRARDLLDERLHGADAVTETVIVRSETSTVDDPAFEAAVATTAADLRAMGGVVASAITYYEAKAAGAPHAEAMVSADRRVALIPITLVGELDEASDHAEEFVAAVKAQNGAGFEVLTVGDVSSSHEFSEISESDLQRADVFGLPVALIVLVAVFGALVAAGVPIALALVSIFVALGLTALVGRVFDLSFYVVNMIVMIGLAVGIDYALFIVSRFREERRRGNAKLEAIEIAGGTASKAVLFSGLTVVLALTGMFLLPTTVFRSLGAGAVLVVIVAVVAMLTLVPAVLSLLGDRIDWPHLRGVRRQASGVGVPDPFTQHSGGFWARTTRAVMARPVVAVVLATGLLIAAALPYVDMKTGSAGVETLPESDVKTAYQILAEDFYAGVLAPVDIVVDGPIADPAVQQGIDRLIAAMGEDPLFGPAVVTPNQSGDLALISVPLKEDAGSPAAADAVERLRDDLIPDVFAGAPAEVLVGGQIAWNVDFNAMLDVWTPRIFAFVLGLSFLLLLVAFRSIVVPVKAIVMNLLSVGAAYGLLVLVFQKGVGAGVLGFTRTPTIEAWVPIFLFCVLFGLSMDYHVFLLSRIREHYDLTKRNAESVAVGLQSTARLITGAALIMVIVFGSFAAGDLVMLQQMGFGLAVAVFLDATIVRSVLVPASMALLGDRNWYLPRWLSWLPRLSIEGTESGPAAPHSAPLAAD